jgi:FolB domain-containing protein
MVHGLGSFNRPSGAAQPQFGGVLAVYQEKWRLYKEPDSDRTARTMLFPQISNLDKQPLDQVQITGMLLSCVIGIFPFERRKKQPVTIDLCLYLDTRKAAKSANIADTIDYAGALKEISFILEQCEFLLIETAVEAVCKHFLITYQSDHGLPSIDAVGVRISKPSALAHGVIPTVQVLRQKGDYSAPPAKGSNHNLYSVHSASDACLNLIVADGAAEIDVCKIIPSAQAALPIGRWMYAGETIKSRTPINLQEKKDLPFICTDDSQRGSKVLLVHSQA